jgi:hypothetical protein
MLPKDLRKPLDIPTIDMPKGFSNNERSRKL